MLLPGTSPGVSANEGFNNEIREVQNAYEAYELMLSLNPLSVDDLLKAHGLMMKGLVLENGRFRFGAWESSTERTTLFMSHLRLLLFRT